MVDHLAKVRDIVLTYDVANAEAAVRQALSAGLAPLDVANTMTGAIRSVGDRYGRGELFLPELIGAAEVLKKALPVVTEAIQKSGSTQETLGTVVIGTVFGDVHTIGKNIVSTLLFTAGFEVIDLGMNVTAEDFVASVREKKPSILAMSSLLTTTAMEQKNVMKKLAAEGLREKVKVIVGGGSITQEFADSIGAEGYGASAPDGVTIAKKMIGVG
jgi:corrinoid protein of di/trimethylamine methyltransferase